MTMKTSRAVTLAASAFLSAMTFVAVSGFNAASAAECSSDKETSVKRDGHDVFTKCDPKTGAVISELWLLPDNKRDRTGGPAYTLNDLTAGIITRVWWKNDAVDRADGPAMTKQDTASGTFINEEWRKDGIVHRADGGAAKIERYSANGRVVQEEWWVNGKQHRDGGPAVIKRNFTDGAIDYMLWYKDGEMFVPSEEDSAAWLKKNGERMAPPTYHFQ